jgi:hypothetical protein
MEFEAINDLFNHVDTDGPLLAGFFQSVEDFKAIKRLSSPVLLHDQWKGILCPLAGGKSFMAAETFPSPPNGVFIFSQAGIDHFTLRMITKRAFHRALPPIPNFRLKVSCFWLNTLIFNFKPQTLNL